MKQNLKILAEDGSIELEEIRHSDLELIRKWKNKNRHAFFYDKIISSHQQEKWYEGYLDRHYDFILLIKLNSEKVGCIGFRLVENVADIYNVILGRKEYGGKGVMGRASQILYSYIIDNYGKDITLKVLLKNTRAVNWYKKNGFFEIGRHDNFIDLQLDTSKIKREKYKLEV